MRAALFLAVLAPLLAVNITPACAENPEITNRRGAERIDFTDDEIREGVVKIDFHAKLQVGAPANRIRKSTNRSGSLSTTRPNPIARRSLRKSSPTA
jgi:hypothetical protein